MISLDKYDTIKLTRNDKTLKILLNRPQKRNALNDLMIRELTEIFSIAKRDNSLRVIVLTGIGKAFCSGADLSYLKKMKKFSYEDNLKDSLNLSKLFLEIYTFPKPVIAMVQGAALAGGCGLVSVCDFIVSSLDAVFGYPEVKIGFVAALVSTFLIKQVGERKARELLLSGKIISAQEALDMGLISAIKEKDDLENAVNDLANILISNSPQALSETKKILAIGIYKDIEKNIEETAKINAAFRETEDFNEGITAFLEKRSPQWQDKS